MPCGPPMTAVVTVDRRTGGGQAAHAPRALARAASYPVPEPSLGERFSGSRPHPPTPLACAPARRGDPLATSGPGAGKRPVLPYRRLRSPALPITRHYGECPYDVFTMTPFPPRIALYSPVAWLEAPPTTAAL